MATSKHKVHPIHTLPVNISNTGIQAGKWASTISMKKEIDQCNASSKSISMGEKNDCSHTEECPECWKEVFPFINAIERSQTILTNSSSIQHHLQCEGIFNTSTFGVAEYE